MVSIELAYIARPLIGAVIGYITNDIAIRMLFRPRTAKYIMGHRVPFTPGLIPKEKSRIAASIGAAISQNLMNHEVLERTLLSEEMTGKISGAMRAYFNRLRHDPQTVDSYLSHYLTASDIAYLRQTVASDLSAQIHAALSTSQLGPRLASMVVKHVVSKTRDGMLGKLGADRVMAFVTAPLESMLAKNIDEMLRDNSRVMVTSLIGDQIDRFMNQPLEELLRGKEEQIEKIMDSVMSLYNTLITQRLPRILEAVNISRIVETRINEMDVRQTESLILDVMKKELRAIVWLGALLGFIMGCINLLF